MSETRDFDKSAPLRAECYIKGPETERKTVMTEMKSGKVLSVLLWGSYLGLVAGAGVPVSRPPLLEQAARTAKSVHDTGVYFSDEGAANKVRQMDYPVKTTRRYIDSEGVLRVETVYANKKDSPPLYPQQGRSFAQPSRSEPARRSQEYIANRKIKFPDNSGEVYEKKQAKTMEEIKSSSYNKNNNDEKVEKDLSEPSSSVSKATVVDRPLEAAGSHYGGSFVPSEDFAYGPRIINVGGGGDYGKERGGHYKEGYQSSGGEKGSKGFKTDESYKKGSSEKHGHEEEKGNTREESAHKTGHLNEADSYSEGHQASGSKKGSHLKESKGHRKGHKTKGFHSVHHKDEYKKDEVFYDDEHDAVELDKHSEGHHKQRQEEGGTSKKGHLDSGYSDAAKGYQGGKEGGHSYQHQDGYKTDQGHSAHHGFQAQHGKKSSYNEGEHHGLSSY